MRARIATVLAPLLMLLGCTDSAEVRYRVTVILDDAESAGSGVWSFTLREPAASVGSAYDGRFRGEAIAIERSDQSTVFALLRTGDGTEEGVALLPERLFGDLGRGLSGRPKRFGGNRIADLEDIAGRVGETLEFDCASTPTMCPLLIRFSDPNDPASAVAVTEDGQPFRCRIQVEITRDPVTTGIHERLPWLPGQKGGLIPRPRDTAIGDMPIAGRLHEGDFWTGTRK